MTLKNKGHLDCQGWLSEDGFLIGLLDYTFILLSLRFGEVEGSVW